MSVYRLYSGHPSAFMLFALDQAEKGSASVEDAFYYSPRAEPDLADWVAYMRGIQTGANVLTRRRATKREDRQQKNRARKHGRRR